MTLPRAMSDLFILAPSLSVAPEAPTIRNGENNISRCHIFVIIPKLTFKTTAGTATKSSSTT